MDERILFAGPSDDDKDAAITKLSESTLLHTKVSANNGKNNVYADIDYGYHTLNETRIHMYTLPDDLAFRYIWPTMGRQCQGLVLLLDTARPSPFKDMLIYLEAFQHFFVHDAAVIGITRRQDNPVRLQADYLSELNSHGIVCPVFDVDIRRAEDFRVMVHALLVTLHGSDIANTSS
ncbi:MAG: GTP-binding protein [Pseudomonadota bacterium]